MKKWKGAKSMKGETNKAEKQILEYPEVTKGSKIAARIRTAANSLSESERSELFQKGMQIIYGWNSI